MIIGITGNSGSRKTLFSQELCTKTNAKLIDADQIVKELSKCEEPYYKEVVKQFGQEILLENKEINRPKLAQIILAIIKKRRIK